MRYQGLPALKSKDKKHPPSQMLRVPTALIPVVKELARLHREGRTQALLQRLQDLIANIDSNSDIDYGTDSETVKQLVERVEELESRLADSDSDTDSKSIAKLEKSLGSLEQKQGSRHAEGHHTGRSRCAETVPSKERIQNAIQQSLRRTAASRTSAQYYQKI
ncbi:hypothetical protein AB0758_49410 [Tolypothrix bouteillei VB521301_2]|uniref:hypothetical protein n=1 Tax=Tolypothrix bouteillei TaxID=1246981 RepID=UPI000678C80D